MAGPGAFREIRSSRDQNIAISAAGALRLAPKASLEVTPGRADVGDPVMADGNPAPFTAPPWSKTSFQDVSSLLVDLALASATAIVVIVGLIALRRMLLPVAGTVLPLRRWIGFIVLQVSVTILACAQFQLYGARPSTAPHSFSAVAKPVALSTILLMLYASLSNVAVLDRLILLACGCINVAAFSGWRTLKRHSAEKRVSEGIDARNVLIIGAGHVGRNLMRYLRANKHLGYTCLGFIDDERWGEEEVLGRTSDFANIVKSEFVDEVLIAPPASRELIRRITQESRAYRLDIKVVPDLCELQAAWATVGDFPVVAVRCDPIPSFSLVLKRSLDLVVATVSLLLAAPMLCIVSLVIRLESPGPAIYKAWRVGKKGRKFVCYKFRTMRADADQMKDQLRAKNQREGPFFKIANDPRITRVGKVLRKYSIDELPQLFNVLRGDMSLVGPRPHPVDDFIAYKLDHLMRLTVTPGLTGLWQITARSDPSFERNMVLDLEYIRKWSFWKDITILAKTVPAIVRGEGQ